MEKVCIEKKQKIIIYGAGVYAQILYSYLFFTNNEELLDGIIVSNIVENRGELFGREIREIDYLIGKSGEIRLFVAMGEWNHADVRKKLEGIFSGEIEWLNTEKKEYMLQEILNIGYKKTINRRSVFAFNHRGQGYFCNCKYIFEELHKQNPDIELSWCYDGILSEGEKKQFPEWVNVVEKYSPEYFLKLTTVCVMITNNDYGWEGNVKVGRREQYCINTWHGIGPWKKVEYAIEKNLSREFREYVEQNWGICDLMIAGSDFCDYVYRGTLLYRGEIVHWGYPRNDILFQHTNIRSLVCEKFGIDESDGIVLYAPTYRDYADGNYESIREDYDIKLDMVKSALEARFNRKFCVMYKYHHTLKKYKEEFPVELSGIDVSDYLDMQELIVTADALITDYSSVMWDFALTRKPIFLYFHDAMKYENDRGFYLNPENYPCPKGHTNEELCERIKDFDNTEYQQSLDQWFATYGTYDDGYASERVAERILDVIDHPEKYGKETI